MYIYRSICFLKQRLIPRNVAQRGSRSEHASAYVIASWRPPTRLLTGHGKMSAAIFKRKMWLGKKHILPSNLKLYTLKKIILWEIAARKLDSSRVGIESRCC